MTNEKNATTRRLVIRAASGTLSFATTRFDQVVYEDYPLNSGISLAANLREAFHNVEMLTDEYQRVLLLVDSPILTVPLDLFREDQVEVLYRHAFTQKSQDVIRFTVLSDLNCVAIFAVNRDVTVVLSDHYSELLFSHVVIPVWRHLFQRSFTGPHKKVYGYFHDHKLEAFSFNDTRFRFCNQFKVNNPDDAQYYLLSVWKQLSMSPEHDELYLVGQLPDGKALVDSFRKFIKRVFHINPSGEFNRAAVTQIEGIPYDLVTLYIKGR